MNPGHSEIRLITTPAPVASGQSVIEPDRHNVLDWEDADSLRSHSNIQ